MIARPLSHTIKVAHLVTTSEYIQKKLILEKSSLLDLHQIAWYVTLQEASSITLT